MRQDGIYIGDEECEFWQGVVGYENIVCCGGRLTKIAFTGCKKKGNVRSDVVCQSTCSERVFKPVKVSGDPLRRIESPVDSLPMLKALPTPRIEQGKVVVTYVRDGISYRVENGGTPVAQGPAAS